MRKYFLLFVFFLLNGCATVGDSISVAYNTVSNPEAIQTDYDEFTFVTQNRVIRGDQVVMVHPNVNLQAPATALFVPFGLTQNTANASVATQISQGVSRIIWQQFLQREVFSVLELAQMNPPYRVEDAIAYARQKNAQFLVGGYITYYFEGGSTASTQLSVILELYDVSNGNLLWSIAHAGEMPYETSRDYIFFEVETAMPFDPTYEVASAIGDDMARLLRMWTSGETIGESSNSEPASF